MSVESIFRNNLTANEKKELDRRLLAINLKHLQFIALLVAVLAFIPGGLLNIINILQNIELLASYNFYSLVTRISLSVFLIFFYILTTKTPLYQNIPEKYKRLLLYGFVAVMLLYTFLFSWLDTVTGLSPYILIISFVAFFSAFCWTPREATLLLVSFNAVFGVFVLLQWYMLGEVYSVLWSDQFIVSIVFYFLSLRNYHAQARHFEEILAYDQELSSAKEEHVILKEKAFEVEQKGEFLLEEVEFYKRGKAKAEEISKAKADFLSNMSHEIRTPMSSVIGLTRILMEANPRKDQREHLQALQFSAKNLLVIVNDILDFSKIEAGKLTFEEISFPLNSLIDQIKSTFRYNAQEKNLRLKFRKDHELPEMVVGDPIRLTQVLNNLISNAIKFTDQGSVMVDAMMERKTENEVWINFAVTDTGIGIPQERLDSIFETYIQAQHDTTRKFGGTGLGLTIAKRLLEMQDSNLEVESEEGKGSRFYFTLRFTVSQHQQEEFLSVSELPPEKQSLEGIRVLVVEDNSVNTLIVSNYLNNWKASVDTANDGQEALQKVMATDYDVVLMDLQMPIKDGYRATEEIRQLGEEKYKKLPIMALTASVLPEVKEKVFEIGMNDFITKPYNPDELFQKIACHVDIPSIAGEMEAFLPGDSFSGSLSENISKTDEEVLLSIDTYQKLAGNDPEFFQSLVMVTIEQIEEFRDGYQQGLFERKIVLVSKAHHKIKSSIVRLRLYKLERLIEEGRYLLREQMPNDMLLENNRNVNEVLDQIVQELGMETA